MKRFYSIILLLSFLVGVIQPIMPMIEYELNRGSLVEFFGLNDEAPCDNLAQLLKEDCEDQQNDAEQSLLDGDYYPLALRTVTPPKPIVIFNPQKLEVAVIQKITSRPFSTTPPPPRLS